MGKGTLTIFSASAGSGKTYKLTGIYLSSLFRSRYNYRRILAVTFTNKATAEMKSRILENLYKLAIGEKSEYLEGLLLTTGKSEEWIRKEAREILEAIQLMVESLKLELNTKSQIVPFKMGLCYLGFHHYVTSDGKYIRKLRGDKKRKTHRDPRVFLLIRLMIILSKYCHHFYVRYTAGNLSSYVSSGEEGLSI